MYVLESYCWPLEVWGTGIKEVCSGSFHMPWVMRDNPLCSIWGNSSFTFVCYQGLGYLLSVFLTKALRSLFL